MNNYFIILGAGKSRDLAKKNQNSILNIMGKNNISFYRQSD